MTVLSCGISAALAGGVRASAVRFRRLWVVSLSVRGLCRAGRTHELIAGLRSRLVDIGVLVCHLVMQHGMLDPASGLVA